LYNGFIPAFGLFPHSLLFSFLPLCILLPSFLAPDSFLPLPPSSYTRNVGAFVSLVVTPIAGSLSDHSTHRWGRRKVFLIVSSTPVFWKNLIVL
jgi:hypothetical protein